MAPDHLPARHFNDADVLYLLRQSPTLSLARLRSATAYMRHYVEVGEDMRDLLALYPREKMEELEFFYICLVSLGVLNDKLLSDLCTHHTWRGVVWGSWLAILQPDASLLPPLKAIEGELPHNRWLVELAVAVVEGVEPAEEHRELAGLAARFRALIDGLPRPRTPLRALPGPDEVARMEEERERIRRLYKEKGADAALGIIQNTSSQRYLMSHERWRATLGPDGQPESDDTPDM